MNIGNPPRHITEVWDEKIGGLLAYAAKRDPRIKNRASAKKWLQGIIEGGEYLSILRTYPIQTAIGPFSIHSFFTMAAVRFR